MRYISVLKSQTMREVGRGNREMSGAVRNVMPLHPSLLSCNREELYGKLLRSGGAAVDLKSRLMGLGGGD